MAAGSALARGGSAYVTSDCTYESLQDNTIEQGDLVYVWIKLTGDNTSVGEWSTVDNSGSIWQSGALILDGCVRNDSKGNPKYVLYLADGFNSSVLGSYTLTAWQGDALDSQVISGDAFRVVAAPV
ncbi:MAG TPA: hypothetical protein VEX41_03955 [Candidatus Eisenbacteria bacterium]|nr:hypothetical protein [Candidatus Eisenbacteria bacterium]